MSRRHYPAWLRRRRRGAADHGILEELADALTSQDEDAVRALLHPDVAVVIDSGGHLPTAATPVKGREEAAAELLQLMPAGTDTAAASINGVPGLTLVRDQRVVGALTADMRSHLLANVWIVCNPDKLRPWNR
jgi:RNA polymerase sigma-70 factor (ECF subfamily)